MTSNTTVSPCDEICIKSIYLLSALYSVIGLLSFLVVVFMLTSAALFRLYKTEQKTRLTMWKVKMKDVSLEANHYNPTLPVKTHEHNIVEKEAGGENLKRKHYFTETGYYKGRLVAVKRLQGRRMSLERPRLCDLDQVFMLSHDHLCQFYGANHVGSCVTVLTEYCSRGSLRDLLNDPNDWDDVFKNSLIFDIVKGMQYLHHSTLSSHGNLKPSNCLIDSRFVVKITDFGAVGQRLKGRKSVKKGTKNSLYHKKLWTAPELLRAIMPPQQGTKKGDVYSFSIIAQEILYQRGAFYRKDNALLADEIIERVMSPKSEDDVFRPTLEDDDYVIINELWRSTLKRCWNEKEKRRPNFDSIYAEVSVLQREESLVDSLLQRLQKYSDHLEEKVEEKTQQYKEEKDKSDYLLYRMLPKSVADTLKMNKEVFPEFYDQVTVYFSDIVGFSAICHKSQPLQVVQMLNDLYTMCDQIVNEFDVYKVETIGDAYMVVSGLPIRNGDDHGKEIARMAIRLRDLVSNEFVIRHLPEISLKLRIGIHSGPVVAGVVGMTMPRYCLFGDTVNTAARMEQSGKELKIHISPQTKELLEGFDIFRLKKRRQSVALKGIGEWTTWWLQGENGNASSTIDRSKNTSARPRITGCDDEETHSMSSRFKDVNIKESTAERTFESIENPAFLYDNEFRARKASLSGPLYERRQSGQSSSSRYKPSLSRKRRRQGIISVPSLAPTTIHKYNISNTASYSSFDSLNLNGEFERISEHQESNNAAIGTENLSYDNNVQEIVDSNSGTNLNSGLCDSGLSLDFDSPNIKADNV